MMALLLPFTLEFGHEQFDRISFKQEKIGAHQEWTLSYSSDITGPNPTQKRVVPASAVVKFKDELDQIMKSLDQNPKPQVGCASFAKVNDKISCLDTAKTEQKSKLTAWIKKMQKILNVK